MVASLTPTERSWVQILVLALFLLEDRIQVTASQTWSQPKGMSFFNVAADRILWVDAVYLDESEMIALR